MHNIKFKEQKTKVVKEFVIEKMENQTMSPPSASALNQEVENVSNNNSTCSNLKDKAGCTSLGSCVWASTTDKKTKKHKQTKEKPFTCPKSDCSATFTTRQARRTHIRDSHNNKTGDIKCADDDCPRTFGSIDEMNLHYNRTHKKRVSFSSQKMCPKCLTGHLKKSHNETRVFCSSKTCTFNQKFKGEDAEYEYTGRI